MTFTEPTKCKGFFETREYNNSDILINQIAEIKTTICPVRDKCYRYAYSKARGFVDNKTVGANCGYYMEIKENAEFGYKYY